jgi:ACT domain-containing protein
MIQTKRLAQATIEVCDNLYKKSISSVYEYANKIGLSYSYCKPCEAETPTIKTVKTKQCALCGQ